MKYLIASVALLLGLAIGYVAFSSDEPTTPSEASPTPKDPYEGWSTITPGGVVTMRIPPECTTDAGAGTTYVVCAPDETPVMAISSDGITVHVRRWEEMTWERWDQVVASLEVLAPLAHDITVNVQH